VDQKERVEELKREGRHEDAIPLLREMIDEAESGADPVTAWPYHQLAIALRSLDELDEEQALLERFTQQRHATGIPPKTLVRRLEKLYEKRNLLVPTEVSGRQVLWHRDYDCPLEEVPPFTGASLIVDVETTGLSRSDEVIELGAVLFRYSLVSGQVLGELARYEGQRQPGVPMSSAAARVHGISARELRGKQLDAAQIETMIGQAKSMIAHNASFDRRFVNPLFPSAAERPWHCSLKACGWKARGFPSGKLTDILEVVGIERESSHRALDDSLALLALLGSQTPDENGTYLLEVLNSRPLRPPRSRRDTSGPRYGGSRGVASAGGGQVPDQTGCLGGLVVGLLGCAGTISRVWS